MFYVSRVSEYLEVWVKKYIEAGHKRQKINY